MYWGVPFTDICTWSAADRAMAICADCPVIAECGEYAKRWRLDGVWGGVLMQGGVPRSRRLRSPSVKSDGAAFSRPARADHAVLGVSVTHCAHQSYYLIG